MDHDPRTSGPPTPDFTFPGWEAALHHLADVVELDSEPHVIVLDEFTYLLRNEPAVSIQIRHHRTGSNKPPLVIAHGVTGNGLSWGRFARATEDEYDVVLYDARGHGFSDAPENGYTFDDHAEDLAQFIATPDLGRSHVPEHSGGAVTAALVAGSHPDLVSKLILEDSAWARIGAGGTIRRVD